MEQKLSQFIDRANDDMQGVEVLQLLRISSSGPTWQSNDPENHEHRSKLVLWLLQQLQNKHKLFVLQFPQGKSLIDEGSMYVLGGG